MDLGESKNIFYFSEEGIKNLEKTIELVHERALDLGLKKVLIFTANGDGAFAAHEKFNKDNIRILAVTFPYKKEFKITNTDGEKNTIIPQTSMQKIKNMLSEKEIDLIQGVMPFEDILLPGVKDTKIQTLNYTLSLLSGGTRLCIQSVLMACDSGYIDPGEYVISMSADTAMVLRACRTEWLFHPKYGLEISEIICKPSKFTIIHNRSEQK